MNEEHEHDIDHEDYGKKAKSVFDAPKMDDFLGAIHDTTATGESLGMPSLQWLRDNFKTKSGRIRYLQSQGFTPQQIAAHLQIKYQHAYNICHQHLKRGPNEVYIEQAWQCPHTTAKVVIDVVVRAGSRDPDGSRVLYRVCGDCAKDIIPGVTADSITKSLPGVK